MATLLSTRIAVWLLSLSVLGLAAGKASGQAAEVSKSKVLFVDSYHEGYPWSEGIVEGVLKGLQVTREKDGSLNDSKSQVQLRIVRMDTKRHTDDEFKISAALKVKALIEAWQPDVVIAADDNASKYLIVPYFKNHRLPFVFCGVNWDASVYGFPCDNTTGMIEVSLILQLLETMSKHAEGERVGLLGADNISNRKEAQNYKKKFKVRLEKEVFVGTLAEWKTQYLRLQSEVDMLIVAPPSFLQDETDKKETAQFVEQNTTIPTGCVEAWITPYALVGYAKIPSEQGLWAAEAALEILNGKSPPSIPVVTNKKAKVFLNMRLAKRLAIRFPMDLIQQATFVK